MFFLDSYGVLVEPKGVKSNYFGSDLAIFRKNYSQEQKIVFGNKKWRIGELGHTISMKVWM